VLLVMKLLHKFVGRSTNDDTVSSPLFQSVLDVAGS